MIGETTLELETRNYSLIVVDQQTGASTRKGVFAGGDVVTGPDLVVTAILGRLFFLLSLPWATLKMGRPAV